MERVEPWRVPRRRTLDELRVRARRPRLQISRLPQRVPGAPRCAHRRIPRSPPASRRADYRPHPMSNRCPRVVSRSCRWNESLQRSPPPFGTERPQPAPSPPPPTQWRAPRAPTEARGARTGSSTRAAQAMRRRRSRRQVVARAVRRGSFAASASTVPRLARPGGAAGSPRRRRSGRRRPHRQRTDLSSTAPGRPLRAPGLRGAPASPAQCSGARESCPAALRSAAAGGSGCRVPTTRGTSHGSRRTHGLRVRRGTRCPDGSGRSAFPHARGHPRAGQRRGTSFGVRDSSLRGRARTPKVTRHRAFEAATSRSQRGMKVCPLRDESMPAEPARGPSPS